MKRLHTYSQNFIKSPQLVQELVNRSTLKASDVVYDIGAGSGIISSALAPKVAQVIAVEYDPRLMPTLQKNLESFKNVTVQHGDALKIPFPETPYKIFANIPFHLSSPIVQRFINNPQAPQAAYLITQKQFARKLEATNARQFTSQLGMILGAEYSVKIIKNLKKTDFIPRPAVDTVCVELIKRKEPLIPQKDLDSYARFTQECFSDPKELAKQPLHIIGQQPGISPSRLTLDQWIILYTTK